VGGDYHIFTSPESIRLAEMYILYIYKEKGKEVHQHVLVTCIPKRKEAARFLYDEYHCEILVPNKEIKHVP